MLNSQYFFSMNCYMITLKKIIIFNMIFIILVFVFLHSKKFFYISKDGYIEQVEDFNKHNLEEAVIHKNPTVVRNFEYDIDTENLRIKNKTLENIKHNTKTYTLFNPYPYTGEIIKVLSSPLSMFNKNYINIGKDGTKTKIISLTYDRSYIYIFSGEVKCYLFHPDERDKLYLKKNGSGKYISDINVNNPNHKIFPKYKSRKYIEVILREKTLLFVPPFWSFYMEHKKDSVSLFCTSDTVVSKIINFVI